MRKIYILQLLFITLLLIFNYQNSFGQRDSTKLNKEVEVIKPYRPNISTANKINQLPVIEDTTRFVPEFNYSLENRPINSGFKSEPISVPEAKMEKNQNSGPGYLKVGAGTYNTTYGDFYLNDNKSKHGTMGVHLKHLDSQGKTKLLKGEEVDSPYSNNYGEIFGNRIIGGSTLSGNISYDRDVFKYYGYPDTIPLHSALQPPLLGFKQQLQKATFQIGLKSNEDYPYKLKYDGGIWYHYFDTKTGQKENAGGLSANLNYQFETFKGLLETSYEHYATSGQQDTSLASPVSDKKVGWFRIAPSVQFTGDKWSLTGGFTFVTAGSSVVGEDDIKLYPKINAAYYPIAGMTLYAGINGYLQNSNYSTISYENFWVNPIHNVMNEDHQYILTAGIRGNITRELNYKFEAKYEGIKNMHFYTLNSINSTAPFIYNNSFNVIYDNAGVANLSGELSYKKGLDYYFLLKGNYYNYTLEHYSFAPNMPQFVLEGTAGFPIISKLSGYGDLKIVGARDAMIIAGAETRKVPLDPIYLLNAGATYELKPKLKLFGQLDNLLNQHYEQWIGYPSQGLRFMAGITFSF